MINKLPKWVEVGGFFLALNAGFINAVALLGFKHQAVSHLTGTSTILSLALANGNRHEIAHLLWIVLSFVLGAIFSGAVIGNAALKLGRRYSLALIVESLLLFCSMVYLNHGSEIGVFFASAACGLQNAMTSTYSGAIVRTTHVSGIFTDLGVALGLAVRGQQIDRRKIVLYMTLISGFVFGGVIGSVLFLRFHFDVMLAPSLLTALIATTYWFYLHKSMAAERSKSHEVT